MKSEGSCGKVLKTKHRIRNETDCPKDPTETGEFVASDFKSLDPELKIFSMFPMCLCG